MKLSIEFLTVNWIMFNERYFDGGLIMPTFCISHSKKALGKYMWKRSRKTGGFEINKIIISDYYICSEEDYQNTLLHEMIHQFIRQYNLTPINIVHGEIFDSVARQINAVGWNITRRDSRAGFMPQYPKDTYYLCAFKDETEQCFLFRYHPKQYAYFKRICDEEEFLDMVWFTSSDALKYDIQTECRKYIQGRYITEDEFQALKKSA